jgi:hypothetical protein
VFADGLSFMDQLGQLHYDPHVGAQITSIPTVRLRFEAPSGRRLTP